MPFGTVKVGRLTLTEGIRVASERLNAQTRDRTLRVDGQESSPPLTVAELRQRHSDVAALEERVLPVIFTDKADRNGYYRVHDTGADVVSWSTTGQVSDWSMTLERVGTEFEVDLESRLSGPLTRTNDFTITGERIHAPAQGAYGYTAGTTVPSTMTRTSADGTLTVYRGVPIATHPRWACPLTGYLGGRVRFIDTDGLERSGTDLPTTAGGWQLHNGLVRVSVSGTLLDFAAWSGAAWQSKLWDFRVGGAALGAPVSVTLLRNDPETVVIRLTWTITGPGRVSADVTLRRGYRFAEVYIEGQTAATIRVQRSTTEAGTASTGGLTATANDAAGNRFWIASLRSTNTTVDATNGALQRTSTTVLPLAIGAVVGGSGAVSGDAAADLIKQFAGATGERVEGVRR